VSVLEFWQVGTTVEVVTILQVGDAVDVDVNVDIVKVTLAARPVFVCVGVAVTVAEVKTQRHALLSLAV